MIPWHPPSSTPYEPPHLIFAIESITASVSGLRFLELFLRSHDYLEPTNASSATYKIFMGSWV